MPIFQLPTDTEFRAATGGQGLEGLQELPAVLFGSESRARMIEQGMLVGSETWRMSSGEVAFFTAPQNEAVLILDTVSTLEGLEELERETLDVTGKGLVEEESLTKAMKVGGLLEGEVYGAAGRLGEGFEDEASAGLGAVRTLEAWSDEWGGVVSWDEYWDGSQWVPVPW